MKIVKRPTDEQRGIMEWVNSVHFPNRIDTSKLTFRLSGNKPIKRKEIE